jgi:uncharacterized Zn-binding protein involved in type VI secretion
MTYVIREGDLTTTDGFVMAASAKMVVQQRKLARMGDPVWCPACEQVGYIAQGNPTFIAEYIAVATQDQQVHCGCPPGTHRLLASPGSVTADMEATINIPADLAETAHLKAQQLSYAIAQGTLSEKLFSPMRSSDVEAMDNPEHQAQR